MTQVGFSPRVEFFSRDAGSVRARLRPLAGVLSDLLHGVVLAGVGLAIIGVVATAVLAVSQWQRLPAPVVQPGRIQHL